MRFFVQADGGARGNPGPAGSGAVVKDEQGRIVAEIAEFLGHATNNIAEYTALIRGLEAVSEAAGDKVAETDVSVEMDSKLAIEQMKGAWKIKHPNMKLLAAKAGELCGRFRSVSFTHIPREKNGHADMLANRAMDEGTGRA